MEIRPEDLAVAGYRTLQFELAVYAGALFGDSPTTLRLLSTPKHVLGNRSPLSCCTSTAGLAQAKRHLETLAEGLEVLDDYFRAP